MKASIGKPVPDFTAQATSKKTVSLSAMKGYNVVLFFYPMDNTPGCTSEGLAFSEHNQAFLDAETMVFGVSRDTLGSHEKFRRLHDFPFELISDNKNELCELFDVLRIKNMNDQEVIGIERSTFLIDKDGMLQHEWRKVKIKDHVDDVLQAAQALTFPTPPES